MKPSLTRREFLATASLGAVGLGAQDGPQSSSAPPLAAAGSAPAFRPRVCNPLLRTPLSLIIDDSCPVINKAWFWIQQRHDWRLRHHPEQRPEGWEIHYDKLDRMPRTIPAFFAAEWGEWCGQQGIRGKFSLVPFPAGVGRVDRDFPGFPERELRDWLRVVRDVIRPGFDITPEMLTHTRVVDLKTWSLTEEWEQGEWVNPPLELLTDYIAAALQLLRNAGIECEGVTSPGAFGKRKEEAYARAILEASLRVNRNPRPFYFLWLVHDRVPDVPLRHVDKAKGAAIASIVGCAGDWFGGTGYDESKADLFLTEDLQRGRAIEVLKQGQPCVLVGHWPCFFANDQVGFKVLKTVKRRLDAYDPDGTRTLWMKNSEIAHYWMARELAEILPEPGGLRVRSRFPTANFTVSMDRPLRRARVNGLDLKPVRSRRDFREGSFLVEGSQTYLAFRLDSGETALSAGV